MNEIRLSEQSSHLDYAARLLPAGINRLAIDSVTTCLKQRPALSNGLRCHDSTLALVPEADVGDYVIVHVGFAISKLDEEAARRSLEIFAALAKKETGSVTDGQPLT